jgi:hypothetical protein
VIGVIMRPFKQTMRGNCGPVAICNVLRWQGHHVTRKDLYRMSDELCRDSWHGIDHNILCNVIKNTFKVKERPTTLRKIKNALKKGQIVITTVITTAGNGHVFVVHKVARNKIYGWNIDSHKISGSIPLYLFEELIKKKYTGTLTGKLYGSIMWAVGK